MSDRKMKLRQKKKARKAQKEERYQKNREFNIWYEKVQNGEFICVE